MLVIKQWSPNSKSTHPSDAEAGTSLVVCWLLPTGGARGSRGRKREEEEIPLPPALCLELCGSS